MRLIVLVGCLAAGSGLASLAPDLPDPVPAMNRALEQARRRPFETPGTSLWMVDPVQPDRDFIRIHEVEASAVHAIDC